MNIRLVRSPSYLAFLQSGFAALILAAAVLTVPLESRAGSFASSWNSGSGSRTSLIGDAEAVSAKIVLTSNAGSEYGRVVIDDLDPGRAVDSFHGCTSVFIGNGSGADGFSFNFGDPESISSDPEGVTNGLAVSLDTYDNGGGDIAGKIAAYYDGSLVVEGPSKNLRTGNFVSLCVVVRSNGEIKIWHDGEGIVGNIGSWTPVAGRRFILAASTGGLADEHTIEDTSIVTHVVGALPEQFNSTAPQSGWSFFGNGRQDDFYLRLTDNAGSQQGSAILEDQNPGQAIESFAAYFTKYAWNGGGADGIGFRFGNLGDASFNEGPGASGLTISWATYNNDRIRAYYDGNLIAESSPRQLRGQWTYAQVAVDRNGQLVVADTADSTAGALIEVQIPGWAPQPGWRFGFGGRTGGISDDQAIAQISIQTGSCGDGLLDIGEQCDDSGNLDGDCCSATCGFEAVASTCGGSGTECTLQDTCDGAGSCVDNGYAALGDSCGDAGDECNVQDTCDGNGACTDGGFETVGTSCGDAGTECVIQDTCDGAGSCTDNGVASPGTACGDAGNECTAPDTCDASGACIDNGFEASGAACGDPSDTICDDPDTCDGSGSCQANNASTATTCGDAGSACVIQDMCDGAGNCADNGYAASGTDCGDSSDTECTNPDTCDGSGSCQSNHELVGANCGDSGTACTNQDSCDGAGSCSDNGHAIVGTACGDSADTECTDPDTCDGSGSCEENHAAVDSSCGDGTTTECSAPDTCDGAGSCDENHADPTTACGDAGTDCILPDSCDGSGACADSGFSPAGTSCGDTSDTACTNPDSCDDSGNCEDNHESDGTTCRESGNSCDAAEVCAGGACPADENLPDETACDDANPLTNGESCEVGICSCSPGECEFNCGDGIQDTTEECDDGGNIDGDGCSATCSLEAGCGNGATDSGETCDDGGNIDGDGCSSRCQIEATQSKDQQKCINLVNALTVKIAQTQGKENLICLKNGGRGKLPEGQTIAECLTADAKGKIAKAAGKIKVAQEGEVNDPSKTKCPEQPDFAYADDAIIATEVPSIARDFFRDVLGTDIDATTIDLNDKSLKKAGICQQTLVKTADKVLFFQMKEFIACKKLLLKSSENPAISAESLEACFASVTGDAKGKVEKARLKMVDLFAKKCTPFSVTAHDVLAGNCAQNTSGIEELSACVVESGRCRTCQIFNAADNLEHDCDTFDDGLANNSCVETNGGSPSGGFVDGVLLTRF